MPQLRFGSLPSRRETPSCLTTPPSMDEPLSVNTLQPEAFFDLIIIGAGPAALAVVTRILETRPAALYTEAEHHYLHWLKKASASRHNDVRLDRLRVEQIRPKMGGRLEKNLSEGHDCECPGEMRILVIDKIGLGWMAHWHRMFDALGINHLRSPLFFHPDPADLDNLLAYAQRTGRNEVADASVVLDSARSSAAFHDLDAKNGRRSKADRRRGQDRDAPMKLSNGSGLAALSRYPDLVEIPGVVGTEVSKHKRRQRRADPRKHARINGTTNRPINERERKDYFAPSTALFRDFIRDDVLRRYGLQESDSEAWPPVESLLESRDSRCSPSLVVEGDIRKPVTTAKGEICAMTWSELDIEGWERMKGFFLTTTNGLHLGAKAVVSAVGPAGKPSIPEALAADTPAGFGTSSLHGSGWCHSAALASSALEFPPTYLQASGSSAKTLVVIGGGLTSAQVCDLALRRGFDKVKLLLRGHLKVRPFDIGLDWMGRYSNLRKMQFWQEDSPSARLAMIKDARQGGSMTFPYAKLLRKYEEQGRLEILTHAEIKTASWSEEERKWLLSIQRTHPLNAREQALRAYNEAQQADSQPESASACEDDEGPADPAEVPHEKQKPEQEHRPDIEAHYIVTASAFVPNFAALPFMQQLTTQCPLQHEGGFPLLTENLQFGDLPLFVVGLYSALQIGPAAGNLGGMREAADRVVSRLQNLLEPPETSTPSARRDQAHAGEDNIRPSRSNVSFGIKTDSPTSAEGFLTEKQESALPREHEILTDDRQEDADDEILTEVVGDPSFGAEVWQGYRHFGFEALALEG